MSLPFRTGRPTIGVLAGWQFYRTATNLSYLGPVFRGVSRAAQDLGCNLLLGCGIGPSASPSDPLRPAWPAPLPDVDFVPVGPWNTDGILVANPLHTASRSDYIQTLIASRHPILFIGAGEKGPTIVADNASGVREAMQHLVDHGHRRIAFIAGSTQDLSGDSGDRLAAFQFFLDANHLEKDPLLIAYGRHVFDGGYAAMKQLLECGTSFTAVLASNDESALGAMRALQEAGKRIPEDVAIVGFDNRLEGAVHEPGLSSVHIPLFDMGYQALRQLFGHLTGNARLTEITRIPTRLVTRASCGCSVSTNHEIRTQTELVESMAAVILNQAHSLTDNECRGLCLQLVESFTTSLERGNPDLFQDTLLGILRKTTSGEDDAHIWQEAISFLGKSPWTASSSQIHEILDAAQFTISAQMQRQYRSYVLHERWTSSRLSLLTDRLLDALDEKQIHEILAKHLPDLNIRTAMLATFQADEGDPVAWSRLRNVLDIQQPTISFRSREFPPDGVLAESCPFQLTLIPLVARDGQLGYMVFGTEQLDLYGAVVQQLGGAFNTARLYHQAVEDRQAAEDANRMKSRFLSTISHELRTPLNLIVGLSGVLLRENEEVDSPLPEAVQRDLERIQAYAQHLGGLIGDVLDLATSDAGQLRLNVECVNLGATLRMVSESGRQLAADKGLSWQAFVPESGPWVWGDLTRLRQVALNLVNNAIKFTTSGEIKLGVETGDGTVIVSVHDTGLGIPVADQGMIFSEFGRSERSVQLGYKGLGLGLAISKRLVELHGGSIGVKSTGNVGDGSTFYFSLPIAHVAEDQVPELNRSDSEQIEDFLPPDEENKPAQTEEPAFTILVVDDEPNTRNLHARIVQSHSLSNRVLQACHGQEALEIMDRETVNLVLLDLQMPVMDGFAVLERMRADERLQKVPVIVVTGQILTEAEMGRLQRGVASILEKGLFGLDETVARIDAALEHKRRLSRDAQQLVRRAMAFIHENYAQPISRKDIAKHISIAEDYLTFCFRQELGTTPIKYLQRYRINRARGLLREDTLSVTEIAGLVGFSDSSYFSRVFHRETGVSPEEFRRSL